MFDLEHVKSEGARFTQQLSDLLEIDLSPDSAIRLFVAAMGKTRAELYLVTLFYGQESDRCRDAGAYFSSCLMTSSAIEALLTVLCLTCQKEVAALPIYKKFRGRGDCEQRILNADFQNYIDAASHLGWIPSDVVTSDLLQAAIQDFPSVVANLFPNLAKEAIDEKLKDFKENPGIEMLRLLQHMRNLVHGSRWPRLGIRIDTASIEADSKFVLVIASQVMFCLASTFIKLATSGMSDAAAFKASLPAETWNRIRDQVGKIVETEPRRA